MKVITICGSMKYQEKMMQLARILTCFGYCVLTPVYSINKDNNINEYCKINFEKAHYKRIKMSNIVLICNIDGYIGENTLKEIKYAEKLKKRIIYIEE